MDADAAAEGMQGIEMAGKNPAGAARRGSKWIVSTVNSYSDLTDGGIEVIDLAAMRSEGIVLNEAAVGGNLSSLVMTSDSDGYAVVTDENFVNTVKRLDLAAKSASEGPAGLSGGFVPGLGVFGERLYILDQGSFGDPASAGVKVYDVNTGRACVRSDRHGFAAVQALHSSAVWLTSTGTASWISATS